MGVSTSMKPSSSRKRLTLPTAFERSIMFLCMSGRRRSRYLYLSLISSFVLESSSMGNGGVSASDSTRRLSAITSISPVASFSFTAAVLRCTLPVMAITNSLRSVPAFSKPSVPITGSSNTTCIRPLLSRRSTNMSEPRFLLFCTQPIRVTSLPISPVVTSAHL